MKFRCAKNSIRVRLRRSEVKQLLENHQIEERVLFSPNTSLRFAIRLDEQEEDLRSSIDRGSISIIVPIELGKRWGETDMVGISSEQPVGDGAMLSILVEKDYPCVTRAGENKADYYGDLQVKESSTC